MYPRRDLHWSHDDHPGLNVLVPGMMGIGFLISLVMLVADGFTKVVPLAGRRRTAALARLSRSRVNDAASIWDGAPPSVGVVARVPRRRITSAAFAVILFAIAVASVWIGVETAETVGNDRQLWALGTGVIIALAAVGPGMIWLLAAITGPTAPRWLLWLHQYWPFGVLPKLESNEE